MGDFETAQKNYYKTMKQYEDINEQMRVLRVSMDAKQQAAIASDIPVFNALMAQRQEKSVIMSQYFKEMQNDATAVV
ncbi:MAG: hypothetical protein PHV93_04700 [Candidatus Pacebacteria bacterium]|nr:hypothetical protein [Candidatus Paceibacterota bacterium]